MAMIMAADDFERRAFLDRREGYENVRFRAHEIWKSARRSSGIPEGGYIVQMTIPVKHTPKEVEEFCSESLSGRWGRVDGGNWIVERYPEAVLLSLRFD